MIYDVGLNPTPSIKDVRSNRNRGPFLANDWLKAVVGTREARILASKSCEQFPHHLNRDTDFYIADDCITYTCPEFGEFCVSTKDRKIIS